MVDPIEQVVAACGVIKPKVTEATLKKAYELPDKLKKRVRDWVIKPEIAEFSIPKQHDVEKLLNVLGTPAALEPMVTDPFEAQAIDAKIAEVRGALVKKLPVASTPDFLDDTVLPLSDDEKQDWLALVSIADESERILDEVEMATLMPEQVAFYKEQFPTLYQEIFDAANEAIVEVNSKGKELTDDVESTLQILLATGQADKAKALSPDAAPAPKRKVDLSTEGQETSREKLLTK